MNLATLRTQIWKGGNDIVMYYKLKEGARSLRPLPLVPPAPPAEEVAPGAATSTTGTATTPAQ